MSTDLKDRDTSKLVRGGLSVGILTALAFLVVLPVGMLLIASLTSTPPRPGAGIGEFGLDNYSRIFDGSTNDAILNSLKMGIGGTAIAFFIGVTLAWLASRTDVPFPGLVQVAGVVPLFMSALVGSLAWALLASPRQGFINIVLRTVGIDSTVNIYSMGGIIFVFGIYYAPYVFLLVFSALSLMNQELEEAAFIHGANSATAARRITLPLVAPAMIGSGILTFALIVENFPVAEVLGSQAGIQSIPSQIYRLMNTFPSRPNQAAAIGFTLMAVIMVLVYLQRRLISRRDYTTVSGKGFRPRRLSLGKLRWVAFAFPIAYIVLAIGLPLFALLQAALRTNLFIPDAVALFDTSAFSATNFTRVYADPMFRLGFRNSIIVGTSTAIGGGIFSLLIGYAVYRSKLPFRESFRYLVMLPITMPALALGLAFLWTWSLLPGNLLGTLTILVLAYIVRFMPQGFQGISASINQVHKDLEDSAHLSGASRLRSALVIGIPLIRTSVISTMLLLLILSMRELTSALFLFSTRTRVVSIVLYDKWDSGVFGQAAAISIYYSLFLLAVTIVGRRFFSLKG